MHRLTGSFQLPVVRVRAALAPAGVRLLALMTLLAGAGAIVAIVQTSVQASRTSFETTAVLALGALTVLTTVLPLLDGRYRPLVVGIPAFALSLVAAASTGLGVAWPAQLIVGLLVVLGGCTIIYHLLGSGLSDQEE